MAEPSFEIRGLDDLQQLSKALKGWDGELRKELHKSVRTAATPLIPLAREAIRDDFPQKGGLADKLAKGRVRTAVKTGRNPGVSVVFSGITIKLVEGYGLFRHPVFDKHKLRKVQHGPVKPARWVEQPLALKGALERVVRDNVRVVLPEIAAAVERTAEKVIQKARR